MLFVVFQTKMPLGSEIVEKPKLPPQISSFSKKYNCGIMNKQIVTLHGRDTLQMIQLFQSLWIKIAHKSTDLTFLKKCRDNKIIPWFINIKHHLKTKHPHTFSELSLSIVRGEIRRTKKYLNNLSHHTCNTHMTLSKTLRIDFWISVEESMTIERSTSPRLVVRLRQY